MPPTTLRRRGPPYAVRQPPGVLATFSRSTQRAAWDELGERVIYQRDWGHWRHAEGDPGTIVDEGYRRDELAHLPLESVPFADPMLGARLAQYNGTTPGQGWPPRPGVSSWELEDGETFVDALAVHPISGTVAVLWHLGASISEWWDQTLHCTVFDAQGQLLGQSETPVADDFWSWTSPIQAVWGDAGLYCLEPAPPGTPKEGGWLPMRVTRRSGSGLGVSTSRLLAPPAEDIGPSSVCADPAWPGAWVFYDRRYDGGTGPFPAVGGVYRVTYVLPVDAALAGAEQLLTFGHDAPADPWHLDDAPFADGARVVLDSAAGNPTFVAIGGDPTEWEAGTPSGKIWRFRLAAGGEEYLGSGALPEVSFVWSGVHRIGGGGQYLLQRDVLNPAADLALVAFP